MQNWLQKMMDSERKVRKLDRKGSLGPPKAGCTALERRNHTERLLDPCLAGPSLIQLMLAKLFGQLREFWAAFGQIWAGWEAFGQVRMSTLFESFFGTTIVAIPTEFINRMGITIIVYHQHTSEN